MSESDFFDRTVIQPVSPAQAPPRQADVGSGEIPGAQQAPGNHYTTPAGSATSHPKICYDPLADTNPILGYCTPLICYMAEYKNIATLEDSGELFLYCADEIKNITEGLRQEAVDEKIITTARYMICGYIDEIVFNTPWGVNSQWVTQSLLSYFYKEVNAGEKFFKIVDTLLQTPGSYLHILDLAHRLLSLGYMGKYRSQANGASSLREIKHRVFNAIEALQQDAGTRLCQPRNTHTNFSRSFTQKKLLWPTACLCTLVCISVFSLYLFKLNKLSDPIAIRSSGLASNLLPIVKVRPTPVEAKQKVTHWENGLLAQSRANRLLVEPVPEGVKFILAGADLFASGASSLKKMTELDRIIAVIKNYPGRLHITGHTDDIPIRSVRFPSNWQLSQARADAVAGRIKKYLPRLDMEIEGMADSESLAPNNSRQNRAKNRRVEIRLYPQT